MSDFLQEISKEVQLDNAKVFYNKYKKAIFLSVFLIVFTVVFVLWYNQYTVNKNYEDGGKYLVALSKMRAGSIDSAIAEFEEISESNTGYAAISKMNLASYSYYNGKFKESYSQYLDIAESNSSPKYIAELAQVMAFAINEEHKFNMENTIIARVDNLLSDIEIYRETAMELCIAALIESGENEKARDLINKIKTNPNISNSTLNRVFNYSALIN